MNSSEITDSMRRAAVRQPARASGICFNCQGPLGAGWRMIQQDSMRVYLCVKCSKQPIPAPVAPASASVAPKTEQAVQKHGKRRREMNKTEARYAQILEADKQAGRIASWHYEGMTLRWGTLDNIQYTADFLVFDGIAADGRIRLIETKGAKLFKDTSQKFKAARNQWPQFEFQLWQLKKGAWTRLY